MKYSEAIDRIMKISSCYGQSSYNPSARFWLAKIINKKILSGANKEDIFGMTKQVAKTINYSSVTDFDLSDIDVNLLRINNIYCDHTATGESNLFVILREGSIEEISKYGYLPEFKPVGDEVVYLQKEDNVQFFSEKSTGVTVIIFDITLGAFVYKDTASTGEWDDDTVLTYEDASHLGYFSSSFLEDCIIEAATMLQAEIEKR